MWRLSSALDDSPIENRYFSTLAVFVFFQNFGQNYVLRNGLEIFSRGLAIFLD